MTSTRTERRNAILDLLDEPNRKTQAEIAKLTGVTTRTVRTIAGERSPVIAEGPIKFPQMIRKSPQMPLVPARRATAELPSYNGTYIDVVPTIELELPTATVPAVPTVFYRRGRYAHNGCSRQHFPSESGVYICVDDDGRCKYVGQATNLKNRLNTHDKINNGDYIAWILVPQSELDFIEAYFIGLLRPYGNFGMLATGASTTAPLRSQKNGETP